MEPDEASLAEREADIDRRIGDLLVDMQHLGDRNRRNIRLLALSVMFDVLLSIGLGAFAYQVHQLSANTAATTSEQQMSTCNAGNQARALNAELWNYILSQPSGPQTADQSATVTSFKAFIANIFTPRDCTKGE